jgi:magnesium-transporting ATPase (P-type)
VIIHSSDPKGVCYVETKGLDGETNLKMKNAPKKLNEKFQLLYDLQ